MAALAPIHVEVVPAGQDAADLRVGDLLFVHRPGPVGWVIRLGQWLRPSLRPWARFSHVACPVGGGGLIEAHARGVRRARVTDYRQRDYVVVRTNPDPVDAAQMLAYLESCLGERYGFAIFAGTALRMLTPGHWGLFCGWNRTGICSGLAASMLERGWFIASVLAASMAPAELARDLAVPAAAVG